MIRIYIGLLGSGKTLSMVRDMYKDHKNNKKVISNIGLNFTDNKLSKEFFDNFGQDTQLDNMTIGIDELQIFIDSRRSAKNTRLTYFILQTRKRNVTLRGTSQYFGALDLRLRGVCDFITKCESFYKDTDTNRFIPITTSMITKGLTKYQTENMWILNTTINQNGDIIGKEMFRAKDYYDKYDTKEIIDFGK